VRASVLVSAPSISPTSPATCSSVAWPPSEVSPDSAVAIIDGGQRVPGRRQRDLERRSVSE
jgi:hypothetical protein